MNQKQFHKLTVGNEVRVKSSNPVFAYNYWAVASIRSEAIIGGVPIFGRDITFVANWDNTIEQYVHEGDIVSIERMELVE